MEGDFWRFGGEEIFGEARARSFAAGTSRPAMGRLLCKCEPSREKLFHEGIVFAKLVQDVVFGLNQWALLHQLSALSEGALRRDGFVEKADGPLKHVTPDFLAVLDRSPAAKTIKEIVTQGEAVPPHGWPKFWCGFDEYNIKARRKHLEQFRRFVLIQNDHAGFFNGRAGWEGSWTLGNQQFGSYNDDKLASVSQEYIDRFAVSCLQAQQWPSCWFWVPEVAGLVLHCRSCRVPVNPYDDDDEGDDYSD